MAIMRGLDSNGDWLFGKGPNDYVKDATGSPQATALDIQTRLLSFLGDCFFALSQGIDYFSYFGENSPVSLNLAVSNTILNTNNVTGILQLYAKLNASRQISIGYQVNTVYGILTGAFQYDVGQV